MKKIILLLLLILSLTSLSGCSVLEDSFNVDFESWFDFSTSNTAKRCEYTGEYKLHHLEFNESGYSSTFYVGDHAFYMDITEELVHLTVNVDGLVGGQAYNGNYFPLVDLGGRLEKLNKFVITLNTPYDLAAGYEPQQTVEIIYDGSFWVLTFHATSEIKLINYLNKVS